MRAVRYDRFGGIEALYIGEVPKPAPDAEEVLVQVKAAGINPGEAAIRQGKMAQQFPSTFPSGQGSDFAGVVVAAGASAEDFKVGDEVIGFSNRRNSQAEFVAVPTDQLVLKPANVPWEQAGALFVAGTTAFAALQAMKMSHGETLVISGAAGGVGSVLIQLARNANLRVIGIAGPDNQEWLQQQGVTPVPYGNGLEHKLRQLVAGNKEDVFIDLYGGGYVDMAIRLGIKPENIDTIIDFEAAKKYGTKTAGNAAGANAGVMQALATMMAEGKLTIPIAATYPMSEVQAAYKELEQRHTRGKIVLIP
ncbi:NADPH:quinone reductase [Chitinophaga parva]|uniref:NADPH:quinone reductase n=2 Tax=Chitinophaga parva TaxID=2169414 RepID=A0A2T7BJG0_9BACT|nr:NADPH:quinone reductase [Chitinophaga parva]